jgi:hypothetical protein
MEISVLVPIYNSWQQARKTKFEEFKIKKNADPKNRIIQGNRNKNKND